MIPHGVEVFLGLDPIDLRWGFDRLCGIVAERLGRGARSDALFVFFRQCPPGCSPARAPWAQRAQTQGSQHRFRTGSYTRLRDFAVPCSSSHLRKV